MRNEKESKLDYKKLIVVQTLVQCAEQYLNEFSADFKFFEHGGRAEVDADNLRWCVMQFEQIGDILSDIREYYTGEEK